MRTEQEILNDITKVRKRLEDVCGYSSLGLPPTKYINDYDKEGNLIGMHLDPEVEKLYDELKKLDREYVACGYQRNYDRGEYSGSSNGR